MCLFRYPWGTGSMLFRSEFSPPVWRVSVHDPPTRIHFCHQSWNQGALPYTGECNAFLLSKLKLTLTHSEMEVVFYFIVRRALEQLCSSILCPRSYVFIPCVSAASFLFVCVCIFYLLACAVSWLLVVLHVYVQGSVCEDWSAVYCCYPLAVCQMIREMKRRMKTQTYQVSTAMESS